MDWTTIQVFRSEALESLARLRSSLPELGTERARDPSVVQNLVQLIRNALVNSGMAHNENARQMLKKVQEALEEIAEKNIVVEAPTISRLGQGLTICHDLLERMTEQDPSPSHPDFPAFMDRFRARASAPPPVPEASAPSPAAQESPGAATTEPLGDATPGSVSSAPREFPTRVDSNLVEAYLDEAEELLGQLEQQLTELEHRPTDHELINSIFRIAHSLKGNSYTVGLRKTGDLAHKMESAFDRVRSGRVAVSPFLMDGMLACLDGLRSNIQLLAQGKQVEYDLSHLADSLEKSEAKPISEPGPAPAPSNAGAIPPAAAAPTAPQGVAAGPRSLRVDVHRLDRVMNLMGEIVINKSRLDQRVSESLRMLERIGALATLLEKLAAGEAAGARPSLRAAALSVPQPLSLGVAQLPTPPNGQGDGSVQSRYELRRLLSDMRRLVSGGEAEAKADELRDDIARTNEVLGRVIGELQEGLMGLRMVPIQTVFGKFPRVMRDLSRSLNKEVRLEVQGEETELDKNIVEEISDPLLHLVRNAIDHGIESPEDRRREGKPPAGTVVLNAFHEGDHIIIEVEDDGRGMDPEELKSVALRKGLLAQEYVEHMDRFAALNLIFMPGFSSKENATDVSGRGVGMDVVKVNVAKLNGTIDIDTEPGQGTCFTLKLPLTMAIINALLVGVDDQTYALPLSSVEEAIGITEADVKGVGKREVIHLRERVLPVVRLSSVLGLRSDGGHSYGAQRPVIVAGSAESRIGLIVDRIRGKQEIVIKSLGDLLLKVKHLSGGTILGDGRVVPILNIQSIIDSASRGETAGADIPSPAKSIPRAPEPRRQAKVLVVDDSAVLRRMYERLFERVAVSVVLAEDGVDGLEKAAKDRFDLIVTDIMMPRMDGFEFSRQVRALPEYRSTPILVVSSRKQDQDVARGFEVGVSEYIFKPLEGDRLLSTVRRYIQV